MIYLGREPVGVEYKIPPIVNFVEHGSFLLPSGGGYHIPFQQIHELPRGMVIFSNAFELNKPKEETALVGAFTAFYYLSALDDIPVDSYGVQQVSQYATYAINWGTSNKPSWRSSRTESRGIYYYKPSTNTMYVYGFGTGDYDFKHNIEYHWFAWI